MPRPRQKALYETGSQWIASEHGSPHLYRFWTQPGTGRTRRQSLRTGDFEEAKERFAKAIGDDPKKEAKSWAIPGMIYFAQGQITGLIKIGYTSNNPKSRVTQLSIGSEPLKLLGHTIGDMKLERALHALLSAHRERGEWFRPTAELLAFINRLTY